MLAPPRFHLVSLPLFPVLFFALPLFPRYALLVHGLWSGKSSRQFFCPTPQAGFFSPPTVVFYCSPRMVRFDRLWKVSCFVFFLPPFPIFWTSRLPPAPGRFDPLSDAFRWVLTTSSRFLSSVRSRPFPSLPGFPFIHLCTLLSPAPFRLRNPPHPAVASPAPPFFSGSQPPPFPSLSPPLTLL